VAATIGNETRWASPPASRVVLRERFASAEELPREAQLPPEVAALGYVALHYRCWRTAPDEQVTQREFSLHAVAAKVERREGVPWAPLPQLRETCPEGPLVAIAHAFPLNPAPTLITRVSAAIPPQAVLEFGYGIRQETWVAGSSPTRFRVRLVEASGKRHPLFERTLDPMAKSDQRWFDERIDLSAFAGEQPTLEFETTRTKGAGALALPVWSDPTVYSAGAVATRPNLLLISIDTLRAASLGTYGYGRDTSPFIDSVAAAGTLFENAITTAATTAPSHMSVFTGLYPVNHGVLIGLRTMFPHVRTLAERLRDAGYQTAAFTENGYIALTSGFGLGFSTYTENRGRSGHAPGEVRLTFSQARRWLERNRQTPFFLFVHTYQVHAPYTPPPEYQGRFADDGSPGPVDPVIRHERDQYDREIRFVDDRIRDLFAALEETGRAGDTIAVFLSDHGEEFLEHGLFQHGAAVFDEILRVPLVFWGPGRIPAGRRHAAQVSLVDIAPTLLDLVDLPIPPSLDGTSLKAAIQEGTAIAPRTFFAEARAGRRWLAPSRNERWSPPLIAVRSDETKFIVHRPSEGEAEPTRRFDLLRDPEERSPLPVEGEERERIDALVTDYLSSAAAQAERAADEPVEPVSPDLQERLRLLGYAE
jgi:arylsulfatase A-like enzyme